jgi:hypothetical protein
MVLGRRFRARIGVGSGATPDGCTADQPATPRPWRLRHPELAKERSCLMRTFGGPILHARESSRWALGGLGS